MDINLVEVWLRRDPLRWISGMIGGSIAGAASIGVAIALSMRAGLEPLYPLKLIGSIVLGATATDYNVEEGIWIGGLLIQVYSAAWGIVYAHFTGSTQKLRYLFPVGLSWAAFSWIFTCNLFLPSFTTIRAAHLNPAPCFFICLAYGMVLSVVGPIDRILRGSETTPASVTPH